MNYAGVTVATLLLLLSILVAALSVYILVARNSDTTIRPKVIGGGLLAMSVSLGVAMAMVIGNVPATVMNDSMLVGACVVAVSLGAMAKFARK